MPQLALSFLGPFQATLNQQPLTFATAKTRALLAYLALEAHHPHNRTVLASLLWPHQPDSQARQNLRQTIARLRKALPTTETASPFLLIARQTIQVNPTHQHWLDVAEFDRLTHSAEMDSPDPVALQQAVSLYRGDLLLGLSIKDSPMFEEWLLLKQERYHQRMVMSLSKLARHYSQIKNYEAARQTLQQQLALEPWNEEAHRHLIQALADMGQLNTALAQYEQCRQLLATELGVTPTLETTRLYEQLRQREASGLSSPSPSSNHPTGRKEVQRQPSPFNAQTDWGAAPTANYLHGRTTIAAQIKQGLVDERCQVVAILGIGGVGKTTLATHVARTVADQFDWVIWRSLINAPSIDDLLHDWLMAFSEQQLTTPPDRFDRQLRLLFDQLQQQRCLLILDNAETIMQGGSRAGTYRPNYEAYGQLIRRFGETDHQSCLLLTSREKPTEFTRLERNYRPVRSYQLLGLPPEAAQEILTDEGLTGSTQEAAQLVRRYSGNPLALMLIAETIQDLFGGDIAAFLSDEITIFDDIRDVLDQQFARLSELEQAMLIWLALTREEFSAAQLEDCLVHKQSRGAVLTALRSLQRRSLIQERDQRFSLQNVVMEYTTDRLVEQICHELAVEQFDWLNHYALMQTTVKAYIRQSQQRLIVRPIAAWIEKRWGRTGFEIRCKKWLERLRHDQPLAPGYAAGNLLNLLIDLGCDLTGFDFSRLAIWHGHLRGVTATGLNLAEADLVNCTFTDTFGAVRKVAFSPDGQTLAAALDSYDIRLWHVGTRQLRQVFRGHSNYVYDMTYSPNGHWLASSGGDSTVRLWDAQTGQMIQHHEQHTDHVAAVAFSPDGVTLASGAADRLIHLWDTRTNQLITTFSGHTLSVEAFCFTPDGKRLISGSFDGTIRIWNIETGQTIHRLTDHTNRIESLALSPDGVTLVSGSHDQTVRLWNVDTGQLLETFSGHTDWVLSVAVSPDGRLIASGSADQTIRLWDRYTGQVLRQLQGHQKDVYTVAFNPSSTMLASGGADQTIRLWDVEKGQNLTTFQGYTNPIRGVALSPDGQTLVSGQDDHTITLWDMATQQLSRTLLGHTQAVRAVAVSPDGATIASGSDDRTVCLWNRHTGQLQQRLSGHHHMVNFVAFSPDSRWVATASNDGTVQLWDGQTGQMRHTLSHADRVGVVVFSPVSSEPLLASGCVDYRIRLWHYQTGELVQTLLGHKQEIWGLTFTADGQHLISGSDDYTLRLWAVKTGETLLEMVGHGNEVLSVVVNRAGTLVVSGSADQTIKLWDLRKGQLLQTLRGHDDVIERIVLSPDETTLISCSRDETIRLWDVARGECTAILRPPRPYEGLNIAAVKGLSVPQRMALKSLGAVG